MKEEIFLKVIIEIINITEQFASPKCGE